MQESPQSVNERAVIDYLDELFFVAHLVAMEMSVALAGVEYTKRNDQWRKIVWSLSKEQILQ